MIGKIQRVPIKTIWENEAFDFTPWLRDNIDVLNDITEFNLLSAESEQKAGTFSIDIVAEDESGNPIIVENQYCHPQLDWGLVRVTMITLENY